MQAAREPRECLVNRQRLRRACQRVGCEACEKARIGHAFGREVEQVDAFDPADAAAGTPRERAAPVLQRGERLLDDLQVDFRMRQRRVGVQDHVDVLDVAAACDDPFRDRETDRERFEVARRTHHHRMRDAVEDERDGPFLAHVVVCSFDDTAARAAHGQFDRAARFVAQVAGFGRIHEHSR